MIDCCIFDLDGVVVDTARYHYLAWAALARELGFEFTPVQGEATKLSLIHISEPTRPY